MDNFELPLSWVRHKVHITVMDGKEFCGTLISNESPVEIEDEDLKLGKVKKRVVVVNPAYITSACRVDDAKIRGIFPPDFVKEQVGV